MSILLTSAAFHAIHYGLLFGIPVVTLVVLAIATGRNPPPEFMSDEEVARREEQMRLSFGRISPSLVTTRPATVAVPAEQPRTIDVATVALASLSAGAGLVHAAVITAHFREDWVYGVFFIVSAIAQLVWALAILRRPGKGLLVAGVVGNAAIIALWAVSRTTGLPIGPRPGIAESLGWADGVATVYEGLLVVLGLVQIGRETRFSARLSTRAAAVLGLGIVATAGIAGVIGHTS